MENAEQELLQSGSLLLTKLPSELAESLIQDIENANSGVATLIRRCLSEPLLMANELSSLLRTGRYLLTKLPQKMSDEILYELEVSSNPVSKLIKQSLSEPSIIANDLSELATNGCYLLTKLSFEDSYDLVKDFRFSTHPAARLLRKCLGEGCKSPDCNRDLELDDCLVELLKTGKYLLSQLPQSMYECVADDIVTRNSLPVVQIRQLAMLAETITDPESSRVESGGARISLDLNNNILQGSSPSVSARGMLEELVECILENARDNCSFDSPPESPAISNPEVIDIENEQANEDSPPHIADNLENISSIKEFDNSQTPIAVPLTIPEEIYSKHSSRKHIFDQRDLSHGLSPVVEDDGNECEEAGDCPGDVGIIEGCQDSDTEHAATGTPTAAYSESKEDAADCANDSCSSELSLEALSDDDAVLDYPSDIEDTYQLSGSDIMHAASNISDSELEFASSKQPATELGFFGDNYYGVGQQPEKQVCAEAAQTRLDDEHTEAAPATSPLAAPPSPGSESSTSSCSRRLQVAFESGVQAPQGFQAVIASGKRPYIRPLEARKAVAPALATDGVSGIGSHGVEWRPEFKAEISEIGELEPWPWAADAELARYRNGDVYEGAMRGRVREGYGVYTWKCGDVYAGEWHSGCKHGAGVYLWRDGGRFVGKWADGKQHGPGRYELGNGVVYEGVWGAGGSDGPGPEPEARSWDPLRSQSSASMRSESASLSGSLKSDSAPRSREKGHAYRHSGHVKDLSFEPDRVRPQTSLSLASTASTLNLQGRGRDPDQTRARSKWTRGDGHDSDRPEPRVHCTDGGEAILKAVVQHYCTGSAESEISGAAGQPRTRRRWKADLEILTTRAAGEGFSTGVGDWGVVLSQDGTSRPSQSRSQTLFRRVFTRNDWTIPEARLTPDTWQFGLEAGRASLDSLIPNRLDQERVRCLIKDLRHRMAGPGHVKSLGSPSLPSLSAAAAQPPSRRPTSDGPDLPPAVGRGEKHAARCRLAAERVRELIEDHELHRRTRLAGPGPSQLQKHFWHLSCGGSAGELAGGAGSAAGVGSGAAGPGTMRGDKWVEYLVYLEVLPGSSVPTRSRRARQTSDPSHSSSARAEPEWRILSKDAAQDLFSGALSNLRRRKGGAGQGITLREFETAMYRLEGLLHAAAKQAAAAAAADSNRLSQTFATVTDDGSPVTAIRGPSLRFVRANGNDADEGRVGKDQIGGPGWGMGLVARNRRNNLTYADPFRNPMAEYLRAGPAS